MMKRVVLFIPMAIAMASAFSCTKESQEVSYKQQVQTFRLQAGWEEGSVTRTALQSDGKTVFWSGEEHIHVFFIRESTGERKILCSGDFVSTSEEARSTATFEGKVNGIYYGGNVDSPIYDYIWAIYPYESFESLIFEPSETVEDWKNPKQSVTLRNYASQQAYAGTFASHSFPSVAKISASHQPEDRALLFHNVCGGVRFCVSREGITSVSFRSAKGEPLAGKARVGLDASDMPEILEIIDGEDCVTVTAPDGGFVPGQHYYAIFFPQTLTEGLVMQFNKGTQVATKTINRTITINRSRFGILDNLDRELTFTEGSGQPDPGQIIAFEDEAVKAVCVSAFDKNGDGELSRGELASVTSIAGVFAHQEEMEKFDEFRYFTGVREIPDHGFSQCYRLKQISFPDGLTTIGAYAFEKCLKLETIALGRNTRTFGEMAFSEVDLLHNIHIPDLSVWLNLEFVMINKPGYGHPFYGSQDGHLFVDGKELTEIDIPEGISEIGNYCFYNCTGITKISFPQGFKSSSPHAFMNCSGLKTVCSPSLTDWISIEWPYRAGLDSHPFNCSDEGRRLIIGGEEVLHLVLPEGIKTYSKYAFDNCDRITEVTVPAGLESLGSFGGCTQLKRLNVPSLAEWCAVNCRGSVFSGSGTGRLFVAGEELTSSLVIPEGVTEIGNYCFSGLADLEEVHLPAGFKNVGSSAFYNCKNLTRVHIPDIEYWACATFSPATSFFGSSGEGHIYMNNEEVKQVIIPEGLTTEIVSQAFADCTGLESITIPAGITSVGESAFNNCSGLKTVVLGKDVSKIGPTVFSGCTALESIVLLPLYPPTVSWRTLAETTCPIYVDGEFLSVYQKAWMEYPSVVSRLKAISE